MQINAFDHEFDHCKKFYCGAPFVEQIFAEPLLVEHLSITASIKSKIILVFDFYAVFNRSRESLK